MERKEIRGYDAVRNAAKDFETYSSDLLGDRDVRTYRQLPLEADPPRHTSFRSAVQPLFLSAAIEPKVGQFEALARKLISELTARGGGDIASEISLPFVIGCLTIIYDRPQDYEEWLSWGPDVWTAESHSQGHTEHKRDGATLQAYLDRVFDAAQANLVTDPTKQDVWDVVSQLVVDEQPVCRDEMQGIANVLLAGGRDTVIKLLTGLTWHLVANESDREFLKENQDWFNRTIAEMVRYLSPLPKMERVLEADRTANDADRDPSKYVLLSFVSANHDKSIWPDADQINLQRDRKPHLAFGFGRHSCMGMNITEHEAGAFLRVLLNEWPNWVFDGEPEIEWASAEAADGSEIKFIDRFKSLKVKPL
jgi:cytochrome P450